MMRASEFHVLHVNYVCAANPPKVPFCSMPARNGSAPWQRMALNKALVSVGFHTRAACLSYKNRYSKEQAYKKVSKYSEQ